MSGDKNLTRGEIVAAVPLMVRGVTKEHTTCRARCKLVRSRGSKVRVASAPEDTKVSVSGMGTEECVVMSRSGRNGGRKTVEKVGGSVKAVCPEARGRKAWIRRVRMTSFVVRIMRSALPFCGEVYRQDIRN
jgi:hypothetical protein